MMPLAVPSDSCVSEATGETFVWMSFSMLKSNFFLFVISGNQFELLFVYEKSLFLDQAEVKAQKTKGWGP